MSKQRKKTTSAPKPKIHKKSEFKLGTDPETGMPVLLGPPFTKADIDKAYPDDPDDRMTKVVRSSVGL
ncbi:MAG: hypothetical protein U5K72_09930 [Balneolaceae bacterium]|nr:hypothetical protein [Balneolaceae bacterium]